jgi:hypothetical protein
MTCAACVAFDAAERAAIEGREMPEHELTCTCPRAADEIVMTVIGPQHLRRKPQSGARVVETWDRSVQWWLHPVVSTDKASAGGFVLADLRDGIRRRDHVIAVSAIAFDHDAGTVSAADAHAHFGKYRHVVYTTASHTPERPRWRVVGSVSRPMSVEEHAIVWPWTARLLEARGVIVDRATSDPCRLWYTPTVRPGAAFESYVGNGFALNVDNVLAVAKAAAEQPKSITTTAAARGSPARALECAAKTVASAPVKQRNPTLFHEAYALGRFEALSVDQIDRALRHAAKRAGLSDYEAAKTIVSALKARGRK